MAYPIGHDFLYHSNGPTRWRCESHDHSGYWMVNIDNPDERKNVSERAIDRTFHHLRNWRCYQCAGEQVRLGGEEQVGHRRYPALGILLGDPAWGTTVDGEDGPWLRITCYGTRKSMVIVTDYLSDPEKAAFDIYVPNALSSDAAAEKIAALRAVVSKVGGS